MLKFVLRLLILVGVMGVLTAPGLAQDNTGDDADDYGALVRQAQQSGTVRVIVGLDVDYRPERMIRPQSAQTQQSAIRQAQSQLLQRMAVYNAMEITSYEYVPYTVLTVDSAGLQALINAPEVTGIYEDVLFAPLLASSTPVIGVPAAHNSGYTGTGQTIAVIDTGVEANHDFFGGRVIAEACFSTNDPGNNLIGVCPNGQYSMVGTGAATPCTDGGCEHGTHVAGIAAGGNNSFTGVAPGANIIGIQIASSAPNAGGCGFGPARCGQPTLAAVIDAMEHVYTLRNQFNIAAVNLSLGSTTTSDNVCDGTIQPQEDVINLLISAGIAVIAGSGNAGDPDGMSAPACFSTTISVGATDDNDNIASFSNGATFLDLLAPGVAINSSVPGNTFGELQGTSMATPMVAGAWAVLRQADPDATIEEVFAALLLTGEPVNDARNNVTVPRIQVDAAVNALVNGQINPVNDVVINEADDLAAIELFNRGSTSATLGDWVLKLYDNTNGQVLNYDFPPYTLPAGGYVTLIRGTGSNTNTTLYMGNFGGAGESSGAIALNNGQVDVDFVRWGSSTVMPGLGTRWSGINPEMPAGAGTLGRDTISTDSDSGGDWTAMNPTFGAVNIVIPPPNDNIVSAQQVVSLPFEVSVNTRNATVQPGDPVPSCSPGTGNTVWYVYQTAESRSMRVETVGSNYDTAIAVFATSGGALSEVACNDDIELGVQQQSALTFTAAPGFVYYIVAGGYESGSGILNLRVDEIPANDSILGAEEVNPLPYTFSLSDNSDMTADATDPLPSCALTREHSLWFRFTATATTTIQFSTADSTYDTVLSAYTGSPGNLTEVACHDDVNFSLVDIENWDFTSLIDVNVTLGETYYIMVSSAGGLVSSPTGALSFSAEDLNGNNLLQIIEPIGTIDDGYGNPTYTWTDIDLTNTDTYELYVANTNGTVIANFAIGGVCSGDTCSIDLTTRDEAYRLTNGDYVWYVRGMNGSTPITSWIGPATFTLDTDPPGLVTILDTTDTDTAVPTFNWQLDGTAANATYFGLYLAAPDGTALLNNWYTRQSTCGDSVNCSLQSPVELVNDTGYNLYIASFGPGGISVGGPFGNGYAGTETFDVAIPVPEPISPDGLVDSPAGNPLYTWSAVDGATYYTLYVGDTAGNQMVNEVVSASVCNGDTCSVDATSIRTDYYLTNGSYIFYVRGFVDEAFTPWSQGKFFSIQAAPPGAVTKVSPAQDGVIETFSVAEFQWQEDETASGYSIYLVQPDGVPIGPINYYASMVDCNDEGVCSQEIALPEMYGRWAWYLSAFNAGGLGAWSSGGAADGYGISNFTAPTTIPDAVQKNSPEGLVENSVVTFNWDHETDAIVYEIYVAGPNGYIDYQPYFVGQDVTCGSTCALTLTLPANGDYIWYVRAGSAAGWGEWLESGAVNAGMAFSVQSTVPGVIERNNPQAEDQVDNLSLVFNWTHDADASYYEVYISGPQAYVHYEAYNAPALGCDETCDLALTLPFNGSYTWYVRGGSAAGWGEWLLPGQDATAGITFNVGMQLPTLVNKLTPANGTSIDDVDVVLNWQSESSATVYEISMIGPNGYVFQQTLAVGTDITCDTECNLPVTLPGAGEYVWYARAGNAAGWGNWSQNGEQDGYNGFSFTFQLPTVGVLMQQSPLNGEIRNSNPVTLIWQVDEFATHYEVYIAGPDNYVYQQVFESDAVCPYICEIAVELPFNGDYRWYVRGGNVYGWGAWVAEGENGEPFTLSIPLPQVPILLSPGDETLIYQTNRPEFIWYLLLNTTYYRLEVRNSADAVIHDQWYPISDICDMDGGSCTVQLATPLAYGAHRWRVQAYGIGGISDWSDTHDLLSLSINAQPLMVQAEDTRITRSGVWTTQTSDRAMGMQFLQSTANDSLTVNFTGTAVDVVYVAGPQYGTFTVEVDGVTVRTVNATAATPIYGQVASISGLSAGEHTLRIVADTPTAIDAIVVGGQVLSVQPTPIAPVVIPSEPTPLPTATDIPPEATDEPAPEVTQEP